MFWLGWVVGVVIGNMMMLFVVIVWSSRIDKNRHSL